MNPLVSICIPTYRQTHLLKQNLDSILRQTYRQLEVLVSDDSPQDEVQELVKEYAGRLPLSYVRNRPSLGSPANWNAVLSRANGDFVLLLHHDDQFSKKDSLQKLLTPLLTNASIDFSFGRNESIDAIAGTKPFSAAHFNRYYNHPSLLLLANTLGAPSNVLLRRNAVGRYDERFKWIVDVYFYSTLFAQKKRFAYVDEHLVKTGRHEGQVTNECLNDSNVLLYENITYAVENIKKPKRLAVFDFYWRLLRNNGVRSAERLREAKINPAELPHFLLRVLAVQSKIPPAVLRSGPFSKLLMVLTFLSR